jgi:hypothetical protein
MNGSAAAGADQGPGTSKIAGHLLTWLLVADVAAAAARLAVPPLLIRRDTAFAGLHHQPVRGWQNHLGIDVKPIVVLSRVAFAATVVVFLIWFFLARADAEQSGWPQRRARAWAFWGWVIPGAVLWIPFQIMGDIWRAHLAPGRRRRIAWLPVVWWTSWLFTGLLSSGQHAGYSLKLASTWWQFTLFTIAASALIAIIQTVSRRRSLTAGGWDAN